MSRLRSNGLHRVLLNSGFRSRAASVSIEFDEAQIRHAREQTRSRLGANDGKLPGRTFNAEKFALRRLPFLAANPDLFEQMIDADFVIRRDRRAAVCGIRERAGHRMIRAVLRSVKGKMAVRKLDAAIGLARDVRIVRDHQNRVAGFVQIAEKINDDLFVGFVKIAGRLVSQNKFRLIDERPRDGHSLLLATGKLRGRCALAKTNAFERFRGLCRP